MSAAAPPTGHHAAEAWFLEQEAKRLLQEAERRGFVIRIEQVSIPPWASGRHESIVTVMPKRGPGGSYKEI